MSCPAGWGSYENVALPLIVIWGYTRATTAMDLLWDLAFVLFSLLNDKVASLVIEEQPAD